MPKILYVVNEDWAFRQHFLPIARMARSIGLEVVVATRVRQSGSIPHHRCRIRAGMVMR